MAEDLEGFTPYRTEDAQRYDRLRWWPGLTLGDLLDKASDVFPDRVGFVDGRSRLTFRQARERSDRLALGLVQLGLRPGDRVLVQLPNWHEFVAAYFAVQKIGAVAVLLIDRYRQHEINHLVTLSGATGWIVPEHFGKVDYRPIVADVRRDHPELRHVVWVRTADAAEPNGLEQLIERNPLTPAGRQTLADLRPDPMAVAHLGPTGGSTGLPKVVPRTHNSLVCGTEYASRAWDYGADDTCLLAGPMGHDLTFSKGLLGGIFVHARIVLLDRPEMDLICRTIQEEKVSAVVWVPTLASRLVNYPQLGDYDLSSLKKMHSGGAAGQPEVIRKIAALGCTYYNGYGGTEGQTTITRREDDVDTVCGSVGKPTCPYDTYRVLDPEGREVPAGSSGELVVKGPGVFTGYLGNPQENAQAFTADGYFRTGDLARIDGRGYVTLTGRAKEMINRGGESISASEVERLVGAHPEVVAVAVVPMPDPDLGERVCAYVQVRPGSGLTFEELIAFLRERKAAVLHLPERVEFVAELPHTKAGKVDKSALRAEVARRLGA